MIVWSSNLQPMNSWERAQSSRKSAVLTSQQCCDLPVAVGRPSDRQNMQMSASLPVEYLWIGTPKQDTRSRFRFYLESAFVAKTKCGGIFRKGGELTDYLTVTCHCPIKLITLDKVPIRSKNRYICLKSKY